MAKWGEGDPRWIVEERPDATNVNNWHWTEKDASEWSQSKLKLLFEGMKFDIAGFGHVTIEEISKCEGEATVNNRKGKLIFFYEWVLELKWIASAFSDPSMEIKGTIEIPNLSEENDPHEISISVTVTIGGETGDTFKEYLRLKGVKPIQDKVGEYMESLKREFAQDVILPTKGPANETKGHISQELINNVKNIKVSSGAPVKPETTSGAPLSMSTLSQQHSFKCTAQDFYNVLTVREMVVAFTRSDVKLKSEKGGSFSLFSGNITGEFISLDPPKKIAQKWRFKTWPSEHFSYVTIDIKEEEGDTKVTLTQTGIPANDFERTKNGWNMYYWESIKRTFGFGATLM